MTVIPVTGADTHPPRNPGATITGMNRVDLYSADLHDRVAALVGALPGVEAATVDGRRVRGPIVSLDSAPGRPVSFSVQTASGRQSLSAAQCLSLAVIDPAD